VLKGDVKVFLGEASRVRELSHGCNKCVWDLRFLSIKSCFNRTICTITDDVFDTEPGLLGTLLNQCLGTLAVLDIGWDDIDSGDDLTRRLNSQSALVAVEALAHALSAVTPACRTGRHLSVVHTDDAVLGDTFYDFRRTSIGPFYILCE